MKWNLTFKNINCRMCQTMKNMCLAKKYNQTYSVCKLDPAKVKEVKGRPHWNNETPFHNRYRLQFNINTHDSCRTIKRHFHSGKQLTTDNVYTPVDEHQSDDRRASPWRIMFFGTDEFALESLKALNHNRINGSSVSELRVVYSKSKGMRRGKVLDIISPVQKYASDHSLPLSEWTDIDWSCGYDVGVVVSFGHLIPARVINKFPYGILNIHPSLLPRWRGASPIYHTILSGDKLTGVTIIQISTKFDVGPIVAQKTCSVPDRCTTPQLSNVLSKQGADMLCETLENLPERIAKAKPQDKKGATLAKKITTSMSWIDWCGYSCDDVDRLYRAISDHVTLRTEWEGRQVKLYKMAEPKTVQDLHLQVSDPVPGQIVFHKKSKLLCVRCKDGWVAFEGVTLQMRKKMTSQDFYNGFLSRHKSSQRNIFKSLPMNKKTQSKIMTSL